MKKLIPCLFAICLLAACRNEKPKNQAATSSAVADTLSYTYDSIKVYSKNVVKNDAKITDTAKASILYPVFEQQALNQYINRKVLDYFSEEDRSVSTYADIANSFVKGYDGFYDENKDTPQAWFLTIDIKVLKQSQNYLALKYIHADYAGGAHGNTSISYINYNPKTNQPITLNSLIDTKHKTDLLRIAESIFRKNEKLTPVQALTDLYFFDKGIFSLSENFYVGNKGLVFLYNPYEIKAYAAGTTELLIPFADLKDLAKPNTILTSIH